MKIAVLTFDAFNELDSFIAASLLNRLAPLGWQALITAPTARVTSKNGVVVEAQRPLEFAAEADAVIFGSGMKTLAVIEDAALLRRIRVDPARQLLASQCSGALIMAALGLLAEQPACTDLTTRPYLQQAGVTVLDRAFHAQGQVATAGGCLASAYLAAWIIAMRLGREAAAAVIGYAAPVGQQQGYVDQALATIGPYLPAVAP